jgi:putative SOS response-associated peptidase YedK
MCYNINAKATATQLTKRYKAVIEDPDGHTQYHKLSGFQPLLLPLSEYPKLPVLTADNKSVFTYMSWGLVPSWSPADKAKTFSANNLNARAETIFEKKSFAPSLERKRCIIPVTGYFESRECNKEKYPYFVYLRDQEIFSLAGIYDTWKDKETGKSVSSFSIITTEANELMRKIHNIKLRMPVILTTEREMEWIAPELSRDQVQQLLIPFDDEKMLAHTVDKKLNNAKIDTNIPEITREIEYPELGLYDL